MTNHITTENEIYIDGKNTGGVAGKEQFFVDVQKFLAIKKLQEFLAKDHPTNWKYAGDDYMDKLLAAEDSLEALTSTSTGYARMHIRNEQQAIKFAESL